MADQAREQTARSVNDVGADGTACILPGWYIAATRDAVDRAPRGIHAFELAGQRLALFRTATGAIGCLEDRCCHRSVPLSIGRLEGEHVICAYHAWEFDREGICRRIPSNLDDQRIPRFACVQSFATLARCGYYWIWIGGGMPGAFCERLVLPDCTIAKREKQRTTLLVTGDYAHVLLHHVDRLSNVDRTLLSTDATSTSSIALVHVFWRQWGLRWDIGPARAGCDPTRPRRGDMLRTSLSVEFVRPNALRITRPCARGSAGTIVRYIVPAGTHTSRIESIYLSDDDQDQAWMLPPGLMEDALEETVGRDAITRSPGPRVAADRVVDLLERQLDFGARWDDTSAPVECTYAVRVTDA